MTKQNHNPQVGPPSLEPGEGQCTHIHVRSAVQTRKQLGAIANTLETTGTDVITRLLGHETARLISSGAMTTDDVNSIEIKIKGEVF